MAVDLAGLQSPPGGFFRQAARVPGLAANVGGDAGHAAGGTQSGRTANPSAFASALVRLEENEREKREVAFQDLAVIFNPGLFGAYARLWVHESYGIFPIAKWGQVYHDVMNAPA